MEVTGAAGLVVVIMEVSEEVVEGECKAVVVEVDEEEDDRVPTLNEDTTREVTEAMTDMRRTAETITAEDQ